MNISIIKKNYEVELSSDKYNLSRLIYLNIEFYYYGDDFDLIIEDKKGNDVSEKLEKKFPNAYEYIVEDLTEQAYEKSRYETEPDYDYLYDLYKDDKLTDKLNNKG